ncbi:4-(cytidine 5'-diphospho)-2-C-methyl-D-erythritol kinase [Weissella diestrammenae]|uniref:4-diphosphocytidyl-2-C-methyl-D-erythritol kinase n=1 Tax=Weissella diestrammenae TaxID=1162633 RepID=A0A7G9T7M2_9LACO|nr:4-(cytidine 5'-diphospho)-2-C-methyl-D-erythritol kinase [Weissella diestrammenae]MCM0582109.1 4-(cytidine 5'-diphospho)-2-C-methyl-D-erythritol kinase [Weissella diestrammenae]QNN76097.1 4-(cytidine 5'-diphospho)-2-C-methyl-D-erythritol kinase [Weissella diestrammenae]
MEVLERAYAKLNISLDTPYLHADGLQEWDMLMVAVDLADTVTVRTTQAHTDIIVESTSGLLPSNERNLAYQAAQIMRQIADATDGIEIHIDKKIPIAAGLGGGSSDAAAVLRALNKIWQLELSEAQLATEGLKIDADVPFCVYSRPAKVTGRGEIVTPLHMKLPSIYFIIAKPSVSVSTPKLLRTVRYDQLEHGDMQALMHAVDEGDYETLARGMFNVLEPVTAKQFPEIIRIKEKMLQFGADAAQMSGTGPTVFGITTKASRAKHIYNALKGFVVETHTVGLAN